MLVIFRIVMLRVYFNRSGGQKGYINFDWGLLETTDIKKYTKTL